mmetsp:Transcript_32894/g.106358  ORF Transcript_32894/g.106358 Transcript_32894/m.106358 type:complete len:202 (+) Transcript_32894:600-1205(+)
MGGGSSRRARLGRRARRDLLHLERGLRREGGGAWPESRDCAQIAPSARGWHEDPRHPVRHPSPALHRQATSATADAAPALPAIVATAAFPAACAAVLRRRHGVGGAALWLGQRLRLRGARQGLAPGPPHHGRFWCPHRSLRRVVGGVIWGHAYVGHIPAALRVREEVPLPRPRHARRCLHTVWRIHVQPATAAAAARAVGG